MIFGDGLIGGLRTYVLNPLPLFFALSASLSDLCCPRGSEGAAVNILTLSFPHQAKIKIGYTSPV